MRRTVSLFLSFVMIFALVACGQPAVSERQEEIQPATQKTEEQSDAEMETEPSESISTGEQEGDVGTKTLVVYFSCTGTTELVAEYVKEILGADIYEIVPENPYTEADLAYYTNGRADQEQNDPNARPIISGDVKNMDEYDTIILGYPNMEQGFESVLCA